MRNFKYIIPLLLLGFSLSQCTVASGDYITTELKFEDFDEIVIDLEADIYITQSDEPEVIVKGYETQVEALRNNLSGSTLTFDTKNGITASFKDRGLEFYVSMPILSKLYIQSSTTAVINEFDQTENLSLDISGSGSIKLYEFPNISILDIDISGSGDVNVLNSIDTLESLDINISGSGDYDGFLLNSKNANVNISGSGDISLTVQDNLNINISGSGEVSYKGFPNINTNISGSGNVINAN